MPSPFPGMDPYIEGQIWEDFHHEWISEMRHQLLPLLRPKYVPRVELRVYIERVDSPPKSIAPDVYVTAKHAEASRSSVEAISAAAVAEPYLVQLPEFEEREEAFLGIYDAESREVVTVIELLSPGNKRLGSVGRREYLAKPDAVLASSVNLVELDLLRGGERMPTQSPLPPADYYALVRRAEERSTGEVYHWRLSAPMPPIPVPLLPQDDDAVLDLGKVFSDLYDRAGYDAAVIYERPVEPPLSAEDAAWAAKVLASAKGHRAR